jgi:hypothetical protein
MATAVETGPVPPPPATPAATIAANNSTNNSSSSSNAWVPAEGDLTGWGYEPCKTVIVDEVVPGAWSNVTDMLFGASHTFVPTFIASLNYTGASCVLKESERVCVCRCVCATVCVCARVFTSAPLCSSGCGCRVCRAALGGRCEWSRSA